MDIDIENIEEFIDKFNSGDLEEISLSVGEDVGDLLHKNIKEMVYEGEFQPIEYERRYDDGGYEDRRNIIVTPIGDGVIKVENITRGNEEEPNADAAGLRIDEIIEYGEYYSWERKPGARPVFDFTEEELEDGILEDMYKRKLKDIGYDIE
ncbi:hypothetical protein ACRTAL_002234 [Clostridium perfringens]